MWIRLRTTLGTVPEMEGGCHHLSLGSTMCHRNHFRFGNAFWYAVFLPLFPSSPLWETNLMLTNLCICCQRKEVGGRESFTSPCEEGYPWHRPGRHVPWLFLVDVEGRLIPLVRWEENNTVGMERHQRRSVQKDWWVSFDLHLHSLWEDITGVMNGNI